MTRHASSIAIAFAAASLVACSDADTAGLSESDRVDSASRAELAISEAILDGSMVQAAMTAAERAGQAQADRCGSVSFDLHNVRPSERVHLSGSVEIVPEACASSLGAAEPARGEWRMEIQAEIEAGAAAAEIAASASCSMGPGGVILCAFQPGSMASIDTDRFVVLDLAERSFAADALMDDRAAGQSEPGPSMGDSGDGCFVVVDGEGEVSEFCLD